MMKKASVRQLLFIEPWPFPLSSRAQPRDLQFRGPLLEMFFDGAERVTDLSHNKGFYGAESKDPGDASWQMLFGAFRPQTIRKTKKVTSSREADLSRPAPARRGACRGGICSSPDLSWKCFLRGFADWEVL